MFRVQRDQNFAIRRADGRVITEREINSADREANIVEDILNFIGRNHFANHASYFVKTFFGCFQSRSDWRAHVQTKLARIYRGKEIAAEEWDKAKRDQHKTAHRGEDNTAMCKTPA